MNLADLPSCDLYAIAHLLRAARAHALHLQCGWEGPLARVAVLADEYASAARDAVLRETAEREENTP